MRKSESYLALSLIFIFSVAFSSNQASADGRVAAGAKIPLFFDILTYKTRMAAITNQCFYEEVFASVLPQVYGTSPAPGTTAAVVERGEWYNDRTGTNMDWTATQQWKAGRRVELKFLEWTTPTTSIERFMILATSVAPYYAIDSQRLQLSLQTDYAEQYINVDLEMVSGIPFLQTGAKGRQVCSPNEWGRDGCVSTTDSISELSLVVPAGYVPGDDWVNSATGRKTQKRFDFSHYADCLLYQWENP